MSRRRIAFLSEHASPAARLGGEDAGGQNVYVDEIARHLGALGYDIDVFTRRDQAGTPEIIEWMPGIRIVNLQAGPPEHRLKDELWPLMPEFRDNVLRFIRQSGRRYDLIHGNFWMSGWVAAELGSRLNLPMVQIFHAMGLTKRKYQGEADTSPEGRVDVEREIVRRADRIIAQCPSERAELVDDYAADSDKIVNIPSAVNTRIFHPVEQSEARERIDLMTDEPVIVYVGRMIPRKGVRNLVRAAALLFHQYSFPVRLMLVGGETYEPDDRATPEIGALRRLAADLGIPDRVTFTGKRQRDELYLYYGAGDIVTTTPWYEPFGLTPLEAMACGRPVVGSAVGGLTFTVDDGKTGYLVPPEDPALLAGRFLHLLTDEQGRIEMGIRARQRVEDHFTWPVAAGRTAVVYEELFSRSATPVARAGVSFRGDIGRFA
jgi:D-inositol-3-phosphate glycosyltransferase